MSSKSKKKATPKIIHYMWLDFKNPNTKKPPCLDDKLRFFKDKITSLHPGWEINYISTMDKTEKDIRSQGEDFLWILDVLKNEYVGPAHKSDIIRFFYLYIMGGIWIDLSTFLLEPLDDLIKINNKGFSCYYMPQKLAQSKMLGLELLHNLIPYPDFIDVIHKGSHRESLNNTSSYDREELFSPIKDEYKEYKFIPENYFIISRKKHPICLKILEMFKGHYKEENLEEFNSSEDVDDHHGDYMYQLFNEVFDNNKGVLKELNKQRSTKTNDSPEWGKEQLKKLLRKFTQAGAGSYLFNYLMMFVAIAEHSKKHNLQKKLIYSKERNKVLQKMENSNQEENNNDYNKFISTASKYNKYVCEEESCKDIVLTSKKDKNININDLRLNENEIYLLSAQYIRLTKWSNSLVDRLLTWENTPIKELMNIEKIDKMTPIEMSDAFETFKNKLKKLDITQIKFSSWTRNMSVVDVLMKLNEANELVTKAKNLSLHSNKKNTIPNTNNNNEPTVVSDSNKNELNFNGGGRKTRGRKSKGRKTRVMRKGKGRKTKSRKVR